MSEDTGKVPLGTPLGRAIGAKAGRKLRAQGQSQTVWFGLGMMGLIGWSVAVPTLLGVALGLWLDRNHPGGRSWTLACLAAGLAIGCLNAWHWVGQQDREMGEDRGDEQP
jgi:ATP synthase protein I